MMPENAIYYYVAYVAITVLLGGYALSIGVRRRTVARQRAAAVRGTE
jgi:hypothetical protein